MESDGYISLIYHQRDGSPSISHIQSKYERFKRHLKYVGFCICLCTFIIFHIAQMISGLFFIKNCYTEKYTPVYFILAGAVGFVPKLYHFILNKKEECISVINRALLFISYLTEFIMLIIGTHYYVFRNNGGGCSKEVYFGASCLIVIEYAGLVLCLIIFSWTLSIIFVLLYFKNRIVQNLAKSVNC
ncbi:hypothetical protein FQA39_LY02740 [Lamprigera yunnana]|nr:hypothetical protein FQA39_LY02740 [Lamprigera yunnana]